MMQRVTEKVLKMVNLLEKNYLKNNFGKLDLADF